MAKSTSPLKIPINQVTASGLIHSTFVAPQASPTEFFPCDTVDFVIYLIIFGARRRPVLVAETKEWDNRAHYVYKHTIKPRAVRRPGC